MCLVGCFDYGLMVGKFGYGFDIVYDDVEWWMCLVGFEMEFVVGMCEVVEIM